MHCTNPQGSLYVDCPNQQYTRNLVNLGSIAHYIFDILYAISSVCQTQVDFSLLACMPFVFHSMFFFFSQSDIVAMTSIGKYISLCLEYLWSVSFQQIVFGQHRYVRSYSVFLYYELFYFHVCLCYSYFGREKVGLKKDGTL